MPFVAASSKRGSNKPWNSLQGACSCRRKIRHNSLCQARKRPIWLTADSISILFQHQLDEKTCDRVATNLLPLVWIAQPGRLWRIKTAELDTSVSQKRKIARETRVCYGSQTGRFTWLSSKRTFGLLCYVRCYMGRASYTPYSAAYFLEAYVQFSMFKQIIKASKIGWFNYITASGRGMD